MPDDVQSLLQSLIRIPSVNPDNPPGTKETGEAQLAKQLADWLRPLGAELLLEEVFPGRPNLIARFAPFDDRPRILLGPHLDTVGVGGMSIPPFEGFLENGRIWGRGASDTKGPMAAMLIALQRVHAQLSDAPIAIDFVAFMGEESGQWGSKHFAKRYAANYQLAVVGEPTQMQIVHLIKGSLWATLRAHGIAAHSSQPAMGDNAVMKLVRALDRLEIEMRAQLATFTHPVLGQSTLNIGTIHGGSRPNIVPDLAEAQLDIRITPALTAAGGALKLLRETIGSLALPLEIISPHENQPMETDASHPLLQQLLATDPSIQLTGAPWFSDAGHLSAAGIPSICMGPGSIDQAHTADEFISLEQLQRGADLFTAFLERVLKSDPADLRGFRKP